MAFCSEGFPSHTRTLLSPRGEGTPYRLEHIRADWSPLCFLITTSLMTVARLFLWRPPFHWLHLSRGPAVPRKLPHRNTESFLPPCTGAHMSVCLFAGQTWGQQGRHQHGACAVSGFWPGLSRRPETECCLSTCPLRRPADVRKGLWCSKDTRQGY